MGCFQFVSLFQSWRFRNANPGRRSAAIAAPLCPGLVSPDTRYQKSAKVVRVCYPLHPVYGQSLAVLKEFSIRGEAQVFVQGSDAWQGIPAWMVDPLYCGRLTVGWYPMCDLAALFKLQRLLQSIDPIS